MKISEDIKQQIIDEYNSWQDDQYAGKDKKDRQSKGQFFTPPQLTITMLEKFDSIIDKDILDPTVGAGGLLVAAVIAGADPYRIYGIELDPDILKIAQLRLAKFGVPPTHLKLGNALESNSYIFENEEPIPDAFVVLTQFNDEAVVLIVQNKKLTKEIRLTDKATLKELLIRLTKKKIKIFKI